MITFILKTIIKIPSSLIMSKLTTFTNEEYTMFLKKIESVIKTNSNGCKLYSPKRIYCTIKGMEKSTNVKTLLAKQAYRYNPRTQRLVPLCKEEHCVNMDHFKVEYINTIESRKKKFLNKCVVQENTGCFLLGKKNNYVRIGFMNRMESAHRVSYMLFKNNGLPIEKTNEKGERLVIRHLCIQSKNCVNPDHLIIGTDKDNSEDEIKLVGIRRSNAKISEETARLIKHSVRNKDESDYLTCKDRAKLFGVRENVVSDIDNGRSWSKIENRFGVVDLKRNSENRETSRKRRKINNDRVFTKEENDGILEKLFNNMEEKNISKNKEIKTKCHIWTGKTKGNENNKYGFTKYKGKEKAVHIFACEAKYGRNRKKDEVTRHLCLQNLCCNQDHLAFGTNSENAIDSVKAGRNGVKLDAEKVKTILKMYMDGEKNTQLLANEYGVGTRTIRGIVTGRIWKHVVLDK